MNQVYMDIIINKENLEKLGWKVQDDRGMSENNGYLFKNLDSPLSEIRLWTIHARFNLTRDGIIIFDTEDIFFNI